MSKFISVSLYKSSMNFLKYALVALSSCPDKAKRKLSKPSDICCLFFVFFEARNNDFMLSFESLLLSSFRLHELDSALSIVIEWEDRL